MMPTRLSHFISKPVLVRIVGDHAAEARLFTLLGIEPFGLWLEAAIPPAGAAQQAVSAPAFPPGAVLVPFTQIAFLTDGATLHTAWRFASQKPGTRARTAVKGRASRPGMPPSNGPPSSASPSRTSKAPRSKKTDAPNISPPRSTRRG
jgi:hypothetical protein